MSRLMIVVALLLTVAVSICIPVSISHARQVCHDEQQQKCAVPNRHRGYGGPPCLQYTTVTVPVCKTVVDVSPAAASHPRAPRSDARGDPRLKTHW